MCYPVYESVGQMEESHHSTPVDAINKDALGHLHEDVLSTVTLNLVDESDRKEKVDKFKLNNGQSRGVQQYKYTLF